jgi:hypothetical protein
MLDSIVPVAELLLPAHVASITLGGERIAELLLPAHVASITLEGERVAEICL